MKNNFKKITKCRVCGNPLLSPLIELGDQYLSGIFPEPNEEIEKGPLELVKCSDGCGHVQLKHTYDLPTMYGDRYGYRSGLNGSMIKHLKHKANNILSFLGFIDDDIVIDIAGNDGTFLSFLPLNLNLTSIDPTAEKFKKFYSDNVNYISDFFSEEVYRKKYGNKQAKLVTSFSMFYDLEDPCKFAEEVKNILDHNGIWVLEQSYCPQMIIQNSFDTICHEHLSYYSLKQLKFIMNKVGLRIIDLEFNDVNGGSISLMVCHKDSNYISREDKLEYYLIQEKQYDTYTTWVEFKDRINRCENEFKSIIQSILDKGHKVAGLGASTKGNVLLQTWNIDSSLISEIGEVNADKYGHVTPGSKIKIISENEALEKYDHFVVLPWHFRNFFINNKKFNGKTLIFPLPYPEVYCVKL